MTSRRSRLCFACAQTLILIAVVATPVVLLLAHPGYHGKECVRSEYHKSAVLGPVWACAEWRKKKLS